MRKVLHTTDRWIARILVNLEIVACVIQLMLNIQQQQPCEATPVTAPITTQTIGAVPMPMPMPMTTHDPRFSMCPWAYLCEAQPWLGRIDMEESEETRAS